MSRIRTSALTMAAAATALLFGATPSPPVPAVAACRSNPARTDGWRALIRSTRMSRSRSLTWPS